ncbi:MAG: hypothetical protein M0C28_05760 [Candidatus Moduliflexus flocculans]|nr:hypothetical protein [Candidatus Moduliflexus flocculans]
MPPKINAPFVEKVLVAFIRDELGKCGCREGPPGPLGRARFGRVRRPGRPGPRPEERPRR